MVLKNQEIGLSISWFFLGLDKEKGGEYTAGRVVKTQTYLLSLKKIARYLRVIFLWLDYLLATNTE